MAASLPVVKDDLLQDAEPPGDDPAVLAVIPKDDRIVPGVSPALALGDVRARFAQQLQPQGEGPTASQDEVTR